jgi:hypothetical protein
LITKVQIGNLVSDMLSLSSLLGHIEEAISTILMEGLLWLLDFPNYLSIGFQSVP